jgi:hypothetical protein
MYSTKTARDLRAAARSHLGDMLSDVRELTDDFGGLRADLRSDLRYLRGDLATDWSDLLYHARADLRAWRNRRRANTRLAAALTLSDGPSPAAHPDVWL